MKGNPGDEDLMRYHDGELEPREAREVEQRVAATAAERAKLEALEQMGDLLRARHDDALREAEPKLAAMWGRLERELVPQTPAARTWFAGVREWLDSYRGYVLSGAVGAAAGAVLTLVTSQPKVVEKEKVVYRPAPAVEMARAESAEVESLEVADGTGTIFQIPGTAEEAATTVIWVIPNERPERGTEDPI